ncbi:ATP-dependent nuclease [Terrabacter carboxydivorans]|uniref:AAA domain-containing protein n=1 Tax=Terrabacter carboxydivorans TaxID=619730 RepID=A0ABP5XWW0_9MICO
MQLTKIRVRKFRNIIDSGEIAIDEKVTCLVGMNESGKTAVLSALHRLNPVDGDSFVEQRDYPRWLLSRDRRAQTIDKTAPIEATFTLDEGDRVALEAALGPNVITTPTITVSRRYNDDSLVWSVAADERRAVENLLHQIDIRKKTVDRFKSVEDLDGLEEVCAELVGDPSDTQADKTAEEVANIRAELKGLTGATTWLVAVKVLAPRLPRFFYFSDYSSLEGRIDVAALAAADEQAASSADQTARALLQLASTTPAALSEDDYEDRKAELEAVGHELTGQVFEYWKQNTNLRVQFDIDRKIENVSPHQQTVTRTYLDIRVEDTRHAFTNNFGQRSSGFRWFFSFLAAFTEFESRMEPVVVLLDEPGLTLHARAQGDLLRFINERLATAVQVIYTTHSPFLVETDKIDRVRIVEDGGPETGALVTREALTVGESSVFPLQAALGYDIAQHLFIGRTNLLVEGPSDFIFLDALSRLLADRGRTSLSERWRVIPAGGASNIPAFVALMGRNLEVTVLIDSGTEGAGRLEKAVDASRLRRDRIVQVNEITGRRHSDIEDLFAVDDYLALFNRAFASSFTASELSYGDRLIKRLTDAYGAFDHYKPADALLRNPELLDGLSEESLANFEKLIERINGTDS